ncbi:DUF1800 domain-containing protein [Thalassomonas viridans]|uniref:DUF1800 domain-containing protein n=1 Tax=Thalassomonas viridans TaxID=137584 RepID=A0AAE9Z074_9GAMM|nr:DUF1800 domain-containing protein [Thalassomonas viridans]WDE02768.1 DUF1800 domain-containing protein [Thalassomonas viridans]
MKRHISFILVALLSACGGGGGESSNGDSNINNNPVISPPDTGNGSGSNGESGNGETGGGEGSGNTDAVLTETKEISRFLTQASFGPTSQNISAMQGQSVSSWLKSEFEKPVSLHAPLIAEYQEAGLLEHVAGMAFWKNAIGADDQLRQRMAFALSQILVVSDFGENLLFDVPQSIGYYQDILTTHAFGNYRELLEAVTYSPAMGFYLTYMGSEKGDPDTGRMPDENYAREILQLFTIGLVKLNMDGSPVLDDQGKAIETYDNHDITGLAKVFTGLNLYEGVDDSGEELEETARVAMPMQVFAESHSPLEKSFLGQSIAANTSARESISQALDIIFAHPNVAPFISRQLIQRFVTSNPSPEYIARVAAAFETGLYRFSDGSSVGTKIRGDLKATLAAVLADEAARNSSVAQGFGKVKEPVLRFSQWARAFASANVTPEYMFELWDTSAANTLGQHPYRSPSVFNFYRPGYIKPASATGAVGLTMPELQILNATTLPGYINFISFFINAEMDSEEYRQEYAEFVEIDQVNLDPNQTIASFAPDYSTEIALADDAAALVAHLDILLASGRLGDTSRDRIIQAINGIDAEDKTHRVQTAVLMVMTSPEYLVQL